MRKKVLIVDDSETIRTLERLVLAADYDVVAGKDGSDAVPLAIQERPDLVLMDVIRR